VAYILLHDLLEDCLGLVREGPSLSVLGRPHAGLHAGRQPRGLGVVLLIWDKGDKER
jgi:hypothetical protein